MDARYVVGRSATPLDLSVDEAVSVGEEAVSIGEKLDTRYVVRRSATPSRQPRESTRLAVN